MTEYEWAVWNSLYDDGPHRTGLTEEGASEWIERAESIGAASDVFYVVRRPVGPWERVS